MVVVYPHAVTHGTGQTAHAYSAPRPDTFPEEDDWPKLTRSAQKRSLFTSDLYFRECWADAYDVFGAATSDVLGPLALLNFKSDGVVGGRIGTTLDYLAGAGFTIVGVSPMRHNRHSMRELWRYNWHIYTTDRLALMTEMHRATETMLLILRDDWHDGVVPGSVRLASLKGSANPAGRRPEHLRAVLEPPNRVINFVHVADEPADIIREVGIFLERPERLNLLAQIRDNLTGDLCYQAAALAARLEAENPSNDFDITKALARLELSGQVSAHGIALLRGAIAGGPPLSWDHLCAIAPPWSPAIDLWDFALVATEVLIAEGDGFGDVLHASTEEEWTSSPA